MTKSWNGGSKIKLNKANDSTLIGFFPIFWSTGETIPLIKIAQSYMKQGGKAVFFSHGGKYEYMAEDIGCEVIYLNSWWKDYFRKGKKLIENGVKAEKFFTNQFDEKFIEKSIKEEKEAFQKTGVKLIVNTWNLTCSISTRALHIPLVVVISGTTIPPYFKSGFVTFPDNYENMFTKMFPAYIKNRFTQWFLLNNKLLVRRFNKFSKEYNISSFKCLNDIILGDHNFVCDDIHFLGLTPTKEFPLKNYIGPIFHGNILKEQQEHINQDIMNHLKKPRKSILLSMGSIPDRHLFLKVLNALNETEYNVIAIYTKTLKKDELPKTGENILLQEFVPSVTNLLKQVDLAIIHGGRGTVYSVAYSSKPAIGIPALYEQQYNIDCLVRHGSAIKLSKKYFNQKYLLKNINYIFNHYSTFYENAKILATKLTKDCGEKRASDRLVQIINSNQGFTKVSE